MTRDVEIAQAESEERTRAAMRVVELARVEHEAQIARAEELARLERETQIMRDAESSRLEREPQNVLDVGVAEQAGIADPTARDMDDRDRIWDIDDDGRDRVRPNATRTHEVP